MTMPGHASSGIVVPHRARGRGRVAARILWGLIRLLSWSVRFRLIGYEEGKPLPALARPVLFCIWHNRLALCLELYRRYVQAYYPGRHMAAMVSASRDGGMLSRVLELFEVAPVRGSSSRRGPQALLEMTSWANRGFDLAITPDGPRGPRYQVQDGVVALAQVTGLPIIPVSYRLSWKKCLRSWDQFQVPLPLALCEIRLGEPMVVQRELKDEQREEVRNLLEERMRSITED
jgi:lysophospholipid acyltransferase (LPLAT)-like uncharacterized protein